MTSNNNKSVNLDENAQHFSLKLSFSPCLQVVLKLIIKEYPNYYLLLTPGKKRQNSMFNLYWACVTV
jgi:hypothetical protein